MTCTSGAQGGCYHYDFGGDGDEKAHFHTPNSGQQGRIQLDWISYGCLQWNFDDTANAGTVGFPDELGADLLKNSEDGDVDGDFTNNTVDLDEDYARFMIGTTLTTIMMEFGISLRLIPTTIWMMTQTKITAQRSS